MYQPETYGFALLFMLGSMICWGSWANTMKLTRGWPFQAFYWDYVFGIVAGALLWGFTLGNTRRDAMSFLANLAAADGVHVLLAIAGGVVFNVANLLLVAAIDIAGMAVAFPIGIGLALIIGVLLNYLTSPAGNPLALFVGVALVSGAVVVDGLAYRRREGASTALSTRGIGIAVAAGVLMGTFYPFVARAIKGPGALGPYAVALIFSFGVLLCALPVNTWLMRRPLTPSAPVSFRQYFGATAFEHSWALLGGIIWSTGAVFNFVGSGARMVGPAKSYPIGQGATMVSAAWGVFVWKEFAAAPRPARRLIPWMFLLFLCGLSLVALAPVLHLHSSSR